MSFFWVGHFDFFFFEKHFFFASFPWKPAQIYMGGSKFWCFPWFPENSSLCVILRYTVYNSLLYLSIFRLDTAVGSLIISWKMGIKIPYDQKFLIMFFLIETNLLEIT